MGIVGRLRRVEDQACQGAAGGGLYNRLGKGRPMKPARSDFRGCLSRPGGRCRRARTLALPRILHGAHPQPEYAPGLQQGCRSIPRLVPGSGRARHHRDPHAACRHLCRAADQEPRGPHGEAPCVGHPPAVRLACHRPGHCGQPYLVGASAATFTAARQDAHPRGGRSARACSTAIDTAPFSACATGRSSRS